MCAAALAALSVAGCNAVLGINEPIDDAGNTGTSGGGFGGAPVGTGSGGTRAGGGTTGDGGTGDSGASPGQGGSNGAGPDGGGRTVEFAWADWPMPNPATSGLPYPQAYDTTVTLGVVIDKVTSLKWQQAIDANTFNWADAHAYCAGLTFAGGGWRLPTRIELLSIVDFSNPNPVIDIRVFPATPQARFWTASPVADEVSSAWAVDFGFGNGLAYSASMTTTYRVRCVR